MPKAYSLDLRERVARFAEAGRSCHAAAAHFSVSVSFVVKLMRSFRATGSLTPKPSGGRGHAKLDPHRRFLIASIEKKADITMPELAATAIASKKKLLASRQDRPHGKKAREDWDAIRQP